MSNLADLCCPRCGSTDIEFYSASQISFRFDTQGLQRIHIAGVLDGLPETLECDHCGETDLHPVHHQGLLEAFYERIQTQVDATTRDHLRHGIDYQPAR